MVNFSIPSIHILPASPGSGKSYLIKYLIYKLSKQKLIDYIIVFCGTSFNNSYNFIPEEFVYNDFNENILKNLLEHQSRFRKKPNCVIIFDDCVSFESELRRSRFCMKLFTEYRHYNITTFIATQYIYKLPPVCRESATYYWLYPQRTKRSWESLYENCGSNQFDNMNDFKKYILEETSKEKYNVVFCDRYKGTYETFKAGKVPSFRTEY
jgi:hypothetical protein